MSVILKIVLFIIFAMSSGFLHRELINRSSYRLSAGWFAMIMCVLGVSGLFASSENTNIFASRASTESSGHVEKTSQTFISQTQIQQLPKPLDKNSTHAISGNESAKNGVENEKPLASLPSEIHSSASLQVPPVTVGQAAFAEASSEDGTSESIRFLNSNEHRAAAPPVLQISPVTHAEIRFIESDKEQ